MEMDSRKELQPEQIIHALNKIKKILINTYLLY